MKTYEIHLIRHGITHANLKGQYVGQTDIPLAPEGKAYLEKMHDEYDYPRASAFLVSPMLRCRETLSILYPEANAIEIPDLRECNFGKFEAKSAEDLKEDPDFIKWVTDGGFGTPPGGEGGDKFMSRVCGAFEKIVDGLLKTGTTSSVIVAHGGTIMSILSNFGLPKADFYDWLTANGCGYSIRVHPRLWMTDKVVEVYDTIPKREDMKPDLEHALANIARSAARRIYKKEED